MFKPYPIICVLGDRGAGKTAFAIYLIENALNEGKNVYTNIETTFKSDRLHSIDFEAIKKNPECIENGYLIMDEMQVGSDSYEFLSRNNRELSTFATQIRKRKITWIYITQRFNRIDKRLRDLTDYIYQIKGIYAINQTQNIYKCSQVKIFDIVDSGGFQLIKQFYYYGSKYFQYYNTNQLILKSV